MEFSESELTNYDVERPEEREHINGESTTSTHEVEAERLETGQYGERLNYDPAGPFQKARVRTDFCWCIGYLLFLVVWLIIIIYGFSKGNVEKWLEPLDSEGRACGKDPGVKHRPYLVRYNNKTCDDCLICWSSCPEDDFEYVIYESKKKDDSTDTQTTDEPKKAEGHEKGQSDKKDDDGKKPDITRPENGEITPDHDTKKPENGEEPRGDNEKPKNGEEPDNNHEKPKNDAKNDKENQRPEEPSTTVKKRSVGATETNAPSKNNERPKENEESKDDKEKNKGGEKEGSGTNEKPQKKYGGNPDDDVTQRKSVMICKPEVKLELVQSFPELDHLVRNKKCSQTYEKSPEKFPADRRCNKVHVEIEKSRYEVSRMSRDLSNTKFSITGFVFISAVMALISILAMRWFALYFICGSVVITVAVLFYITYEKIASDMEDITTGVLLALFVCLVLGVLVSFIVLVVLYMRRELFKSCKMIKESSKAITGMMWTLLFALVIAFIYGMVLTMGVNLYFALSSIETPIYEVDFEPGDQCICPPELGYNKQNATCDPVTFDSNCLTADKKKCAASRCYLVRYEPHRVGFLHFINYVGLYWSFWFCLGLVDSVLANVFSNWYWTFNKNVLTYVTLIEGFWIIGFYHLGTVALGSIAILVCEIVRCVLSAICKILEKINQPFTALILMQMRWVYDLLETFLNYINSRAYVACAMHGTDFLHSARSAYYLMMRNINKVYRVAEISNWLTFIIALLISTVISKISVGYYQTREDEVAYAGVPSFFVFAGSLLVTWLMLRVVEVAVETIYQCFLEDSERNDGSCDKPFFASEQVSKILYKNQI